MKDIDIALGQNSVNLIDYYYRTLNVNSGILETNIQEQTVLDEVGGIMESMVNAAFDSADNYMQNRVYELSDKFYEALGINKDSLELSGKVIDMINTSITHFSCILKLVPTNIIMVPSARQTLTSMISSYKTLLMAAYVDIKAMYYKTKNALINNMPTTLEILILTENTILDMMINQIDQLTYQYLGYTLQELYMLCREGINKFKAWRDALRRLREMSNDDNGTYTEYGMTVNVNLNINDLKETFMAWLAAQNDAIYNGFILLQIRDIISNVMFLIQEMTNIDLKVLAETINSLDEFIEFMRELGCDNEKNIITLDEVKQFLINHVAFAMNSLQESLLNQVSVDIDLYNKAQFTISTDIETHTANIILYEHPDKRDTIKKIYKIFKEAKNEDNTQIFNEYELQQLQNKILELYRNNTNGSIQLKGLNVQIIFEIREEEDEPEPQPALSNESYELGFILEEYSHEPTENPKRKTIQIIHTLFDLFIQIMPYMKTFATLASNYKTNKMLAKTNAKANLFKLFKINCKNRGLNKHINTADKNFYTVRSLHLYNYVNNSFIHDKLITHDYTIEKEQTNEMISWLNDNSIYHSLHNDMQTTLYIDYDNIKKQQEQLDSDTEKAMEFFKEDVSLFVNLPDSEFKDGTYNCLNDLEVMEDDIFYNDSSLPVSSSQLWIAFSKQLDPSI